MKVSYNGLWKLLIDHEIKKMDLVEELGISTSALTKMSRGEPVSMQILTKICDKRNCDFDDLVSYQKTAKR